jgi:hypothetical protein
MPQSSTNELDALERDLDDLISTGPAAYSDGDSQVRLSRISVLAAGEFDTWGEWGNDGAKSAAAWMSTRCHRDLRECRVEIKRARELRNLDKVRAAYEAGDLTTAHLDLFMHAKTARTEASMDRDEEVLVEEAKKLRFSDFKSTISYWSQLADADGSEEAARRRYEARDAYLVQSGDGYLGRMSLDPFGGAIVSAELERLERALFEADWAEATERLGRTPLPGELRRTSQQRRADALVEMAERSASLLNGSKRAAPLFTVLVGYETLHGRTCELENGMIVTPGSLWPWITEADMERAVFGPDGRVEVSKKTRFFTGATRRAMEIRDRQCGHEYCEEPPERCQGDHVTPYSEGGETSQENGQLLCGFHNRLRNQDRPPQRE